MSDAPVAIVTGGGRGIGRATTIELARRGFIPVVVARTRSELDETVALAGVGEAVVADVASPAAGAQVVDHAISRFGRIDVLVNNAGFASMQPIGQVDDALWQRTIDVNLSAAFRFSRDAWPHLRAARGAIVNVSSESTRDPFPGFAAYAAAKAGLNGLSLALAREGAAEGIRVYTVSPGSSETAMFRSLVSEQQCSRDKTLDPAEVARVIADCLTGPLRHTPGEIIYLKRS